MRVISTVVTPSSGIKDISELVSASGAAHQSDTLVTVAPTGLLHEFLNHGARKHALKGDGRVWFNVLGSAPASPVMGDMWLEGGSGSVNLKFYDGTGTRSIPATDPSLGLVTAAAVLQGHAVRASAGGVDYAAAIVDAAFQYRVIGLVAADTAMGDPVTVLTDGDIMTLADWSLMTGAVNLLPNRTYWISGTPGRYTTTPNAAVAAQVGIAISPTQLMVRPSLVVLS